MLSRKDDKSKPVILEACVEPKEIKVHARIAYHPKEDYLPIDVIKAKWTFKPFKGLTSPCLNRNWTRHDF